MGRLAGYFELKSVYFISHIAEGYVS